MDADDTFLGGKPPVHIQASRCGSITINIKFEIHADDPELRAQVERLIGRDLAIEGGEE